MRLPQGGTVIVIKLGGDAVATPEHIAAAARRIARERATREVVVVVSARRGVTDQLLALVAAVGRHTAGPGAPNAAVADRAVASGEIVAASLVALALEHLGLPARALDAREAGLEGDGRSGGSRITRIRTGRLRALLRRNLIPVVAGFQTHHNGELALLGRGGSDVTAVAIAAALGAEACVLLKRAGLRDADPVRHPHARHVGVAGFDVLDALLQEGSRVLAVDAARLARRCGVPLTFVPFPEEGPVSRILPGSSSLRPGTTRGPAPGPRAEAGVGPSP
ncbi:MAG: hypothetical protein V4558_00500 [Gemmatimonadota bacterium]